MLSRIDNKHTPHGVDVYPASEVFIFGSIANGKFNEDSDIDIAIKGINEKDFYKVASILTLKIIILRKKYQATNKEGHYGRN